MRTFFALLAAVNPPAVAVSLKGRERAVLITAGITITLLLVVAWAAASEAVLDSLDVGPPTFRIATGIVLGVTAARCLVVGGHVITVPTPVSSWRRLLVPVLIPVLLTPQLVMVAIARGADDGVAVVALAAVLSLAMAGAFAVTGDGGEVWVAAARFVAALGIVVALDLAVDGVKSV
jgi:small neutral amino acid transporter SnatA (MarC family)